MDDLDPALLDRLTAASFALGVEDAVRGIADDVAGWDADHLTASQIDNRILEWAAAHGWDYDDWLQELERDRPGLWQAFPTLNPKRVWELFGFDQWLIDCVRSYAFTDEPIPFLPFAAGLWIEQPESNPPMLACYITALTDPQIAAKQLIEKHKRLFGAKAGRSTRAQDVDNARMLHKHRQGMSYREIAIQNLRDKHPDIITNPNKYRKPLKTERERVVKCIAAAEELWKERLPESSTPE